AQANRLQHLVEADLDARGDVALGPRREPRGEAIVRRPRLVHPEVTTDARGARGQAQSAERASQLAIEPPCIAEPVLQPRVFIVDAPELDDRLLQRIQL